MSKIKILAVATEWSSAHGGVSTYNRKLCIALATSGIDVTCLVVHAEDREFKEAQASGINLVAAMPIPGASDRAMLLGRPGFAPENPPDIIIGHGRITGAAAYALRRDHFPEAFGVHVVHMAADEIEWHKVGREPTRDATRTAADRTHVEIELARQADLVAAVGPLLTDRFDMELSGYGVRRPVLRLDPGFSLDDANAQPRVPPRGNPVRVLVLGRLEDSKLKGLRTAARAVGHAAEFLPAGIDLELLVRGTPPGEGTSLRENLQKWCRQPSVKILPREYSIEPEQVAADLRSSSLLLMPSLAEGFGLAGVEAIEFGTPPLVAQNSGLGAYLREILPEQEAARIVVNDGRRRNMAWGQEVLRIIRDRESAFRDVDRLRRDLANRRPWSAVASDLLATIEVSV